MSPLRTLEPGSTCWVGHRACEQGGGWASLSDVLISTDGAQPLTGATTNTPLGPGPGHVGGARGCREETQPGTRGRVTTPASRGRRGRGPAPQAARAQGPRSLTRGPPVSQTQTPHADSCSHTPAPRASEEPALTHLRGDESLARPEDRVPGSQAGVCPLLRRVTEHM